MVATVAIFPAVPPLVSVAIWVFAFLSLMAVIFTIGRGMDKRVTLGMICGVTVLLNVALNAAGDTLDVCTVCSRIEPYSFYWWAWGCIWC
jgi:hypothetical membrane protein